MNAVQDVDVLELAAPPRLAGARTAADLLPDSRCRDPKNRIWRGSWWVPVFCANCGTPYGWVPEENCDFACWLCPPCVERWGAVANLLLMPDEVFWEKVRAEQIEQHGRLLTDAELVAEYETGTGSLATLLREGASP